MTDDSLDLDTRREIYEYIVKNPGVNLSKISEEIKKSAQLVDYHLIYLERHSLITVDKEKGFKQCFIKDKIGAEDKRLLGLLQQDLLLQIVLFLLEHPFSRHGDMLKHFKMTSPRFSYHLRKLVKNDVIVESTIDDEKGYIIHDPEIVIDVLIRYKPSVVAAKVKDTWKDFGSG
jgi:predicted transcriptional regulator